MANTAYCPETRLRWMSCLIIPHFHHLKKEKTERKKEKRKQISRKVFDLDRIHPLSMDTTITVLSYVYHTMNTIAGITTTRHCSVIYAATFYHYIIPSCVDTLLWFHCYCCKSFHNHLHLSLFSLLLLEFVVLEGFAIFLPVVHAKPFK